MIKKDEKNKKDKVLLSIYGSFIIFLFNIVHVNALSPVLPSNPIEPIELSITFKNNDFMAIYEYPDTWCYWEDKPDNTCFDCGNWRTLSCKTVSNSCTIKNGPPEVFNKYFNFKGWSKERDCSTITSLTFPITLSLKDGWDRRNRDWDYYACWEEIPACYLCGNKYMHGNYAKNIGTSCSYYSNDNQSTCDSYNREPIPQQKPEALIDPKANLITYYKITYDLDGGHYIDGSTTRTQIVRGDKAIGDFSTNPVKKGKSFVEWQYNGSEFDLSQKLDDVAADVTADSE